MGLPSRESGFWTEAEACEDLAQSGERAVVRESMFRVKPTPEHLPAMDAFGVPVAVCGFEDVRDWFYNAAELRGRFPKVVLFAGARSLARATSDAAHRARLLRADVILGEGSAVAAYAKLAAAPMRERFDAVATLERLLASADGDRHVRVFLCGDDAKHMAVAKKVIESRFPNVLVVGAADARTNANISEDVSEAGTDVVLVGMGGDTEEWIEENMALLDVGVVVGVGDALDAISGMKKTKQGTRPLGIFAALVFMIRATLYLAFPAKPVSALNG
jgi:exopolysaccharide biosynthesis WecB/TagA/CpsF family protein